MQLLDRFSDYFVGEEEKFLFENSKRKQNVVRLSHIEYVVEIYN